MGTDGILDLAAKGHAHLHGQVVALLATVALVRVHAQVEDQRTRLEVVEEALARHCVRLPGTDSHCRELAALVVVDDLAR